MAHSTPAQRRKGGSAPRSAAPTSLPPGIPLWPGVLVTAICGVVFFSAGVGRFGFRASQYCHHSMTAYAWTQGRLYCTKDEIQRLFYVQWFADKRHEKVPPTVSTDELRTRYREIYEAGWRRSGYTENQIRVQLGRLEKSGMHDWVQLDGRCYAYWPPVPALLLLPFVAAVGPGFSDVFFTNLLATLSVWFMYLAVRALKPHWPELTAPACAALALLYGLGTCHFYQGTIGQVWYVTQLCGSLFLIIAIWLGIRAITRPVAIIPAGVALVLGFLSRNTIILAAPFFAVTLWMAVRVAPDRITRFLKYGTGFALVLIAGIGIQLGFNQARFGDPLDFGQGHLADAGGNPRFKEDFAKYGRFNLFYVPRNITSYFLRIPWPWPIKLGHIDYTPHKHPTVPGWTYDPDGDSLLFLSPAMFYLFLCWRQKRRDLLIAVLAGLLPGTTALMLFHGTGWYQFGQRYLLDTMAFFVLLAGFGMRGRLSGPAGVLIALSVAMNAWGTYRFGLEQPP